MNDAEKKNEEDEEMHDEEGGEGLEQEKQEVGPPIYLNSETGELKIDEARFSLDEKPYTVRLLFKTYRECKEFIEQV